MKEQTLSSTLLCPVIYRFLEQLCETWFGTPEGQRAEAFGCRWRCYGPRQDVATDAIHLAGRWRPRWASVETYLRNRWSETLRLKLRASHGSYQVCNVVYTVVW